MNSKITKIKDAFDDLIWSVKAFFYQPIVPRVSPQYIVEKDLSYSSSSKNRKWDYYWEGNFISGREVKVLHKDIVPYIPLKYRRPEDIKPEEVEEYLKSKR